MGHVEAEVRGHVVVGPDQVPDLHPPWGYPSRKGLLQRRHSGAGAFLEPLQFLRGGEVPLVLVELGVLEVPGDVREPLQKREVVLAVLEAKGRPQQEDNHKGLAESFTNSNALSDLADLH